MFRSATNQRLMRHKLGTCRAEELEVTLVRNFFEDCRLGPN